MTKTISKLTQLGYFNNFNLDNMINQELNKINMKTLKEIQESNRRKIICDVHNTEDYKEALEAELGYGCIVMLGSGKHRVGDEDMSLHTNKYGEGRYISSHNDYCENCLEPRKLNFKIIGKPLTLNRVLISIGEIKSNINGKQLHSELITIIEGDCKHLAIEQGIAATMKYDSGDLLFKWDLTKETLEEQTEETQRAINELLTKTKEKQC